MPILIFFLILAILLVIGFVIRLAMHPVETLIGTVRLISFLVAAGTWIAFFVSLSVSDSGGVWELLILAIPATLIWLGTFALRR